MPELLTLQEALYTDPFDQSLHLYHHWLLASTCSPSSSYPTSAKAEIVSLPASAKASILRSELDWMKELLQEEPECKYLLEELIFVDGLHREVVKEEGNGDGDTGEPRKWLEKLIQVDPMRMGRWQEMQAAL